MLSSRDITPAGLGGISLALLLHYCLCWHQLRHQTGTHRIWRRGCLQSFYMLSKKPCSKDVESVLALCRCSRCWFVDQSEPHTATFSFSVFLRGRNLFLGACKTLETRKLSQTSQGIYVCRGWAVKTLTSLASARTPAFWSSSQGLSSSSPDLSSPPAGRRFGPENKKIGLSGHIFKVVRDLQQLLL